MNKIFDFPPGSSISDYLHPLDQVQLNSIIFKDYLFKLHEIALNENISFDLLVYAILEDFIEDYFSSSDYQERPDA